MLLNATDEELALAIENNVESAFSLLASLYPNAELESTPQWVRYSSDVPYPIGNIVVRSRLEESTLNEQVSKILGIYRSLGMPMMWFVSPSSEPSNLASLLTENGGRKIMDAPGLAVDLAQQSLEREPIDGFEIIEARTPEEIGAWGNTACEVFGLDSSVKGFFEHVPTEGGPVLRSYLGLLQGVPVATSMMTVSDGVAGIYCVGTKSEVRNKGIGARMTLHPMKEAQVVGCQYAILQSSELGLSVYKSLGFRELCNFERFVFMPA